jgi:hypothetical protein
MEVRTPAPHLTECGYFDVAEVQRISDRLLLTLAAAAVAKTTGDLFKAPPAGRLRNACILRRIVFKTTFN